MAITIVDIKVKDFLTFNPRAFDDHQIRILKEYLEDTPTPFVNHYGRKGWESKYDPKYTKGTKPRDARRVVPQSSTLPDKRWVKQRIPEGSTAEKTQWAQDRDAWLSERKVKYQMCLVMVEDGPAWVHLFKKANDALLFKLTWG